MQTNDPMERLHNELVAAFDEHFDLEAPGLVAVMRRSLAFAQIGHSSHQVVIDRRALIFGMIAVGADPVYRRHNRNTATWFADWLRARVPGLEEVPARALTPESELHDAADQGFKVVASDSVRAILPNAVEYAQLTVGRTVAALRHLFLALLTDPRHVLQIEELKWSLGPPHRDDLCATLLAHIEDGAEAGEDMAAWRRLFDRVRPLSVAPEAPHSAASSSADGGPQPAKGSRAGKRGGRGGGSERSVPSSRTATRAFFVSGFAADKTSDKDGDPLDTEADVLAMARLICHQDAAPPISIGVFGGWGSGKTTFMEKLQAQVKILSSPAAKAASEGPRFASPIVQIRFNAWQFTDANLWASITAEFFDQLRAGGFDKLGTQKHAELIEEVNAHVRGLSEAAAARRAAVGKAERHVREAQAARDEAVAKGDEALQQSLVTGLAEAFQRNRSRLSRLGVIGEGLDQLKGFVEVAQESQQRWGALKLIGRVLLAQWRLLLGLALAIAAAAALLLYLADGALDTALVALGTTAAAVLSVTGRALTLIRPLLRETAPLAAGLELADSEALGAVMAREVALQVAAEEAEARRSAADRANRVLARYVDPSAPSNPPRLLRYLLEDDPDTKAFETEIGLMGRARRAFEALNRVVAENRKAAAAPQGNAPQAIQEDVPERIILYIDDLDRCTHEQVYKVLQAVHLLLAFELFVVIVAVDVEWVEAAVAKNLEFAGSEILPSTAPNVDRRARAIEYLSKIFQLPFWLKPFTSDEGDDRYASYISAISGKVIRDAAPPPPPSPAVGDPSTPVSGSREPVEAAVAGEAKPARAPAGETRSATAAPSETGTAAVERALATLQLHEKEVAFLASPEIAAVAAKDPRGVKRLVNVYKIARARLSEMDDGMILGDASRAPTYPLIALCAAIETGQAFAVADNLYKQLIGAGEKTLLEELPTTDRIKAAVAAVMAAREGRGVRAREALKVARIIRRYSFNKFH